MAMLLYFYVVSLPSAKYLKICRRLARGSTEMYRRTTNNKNVKRPQWFHKNKNQKKDQKETPTTTNTKNGRLVIRNLSFKVTEEALQNWFAKYGKVVDVKLLRKADGNLVGCGFVEFNSVINATNAIRECNAKPFLGRPITVDFAVPKQKYSGTSIKPQPLQESYVDVEEEEEEHEAEEEEEEEAEKQKEGIKLKEKEAVVSHSPHHPHIKRDNTEGRMKRLVVRNLNFSVTEEAVQDWFSKFGEVLDVKLLRKPNGNLVGCGFIQYRSYESAAEAIKQCNGKSFLGRSIGVDYAVSKEEYEASNKKTPSFTNGNVEVNQESENNISNSHKETSDGRDNSTEGDKHFPENSGKPTRKRGNPRKGRLIVRNLSFKSTEENVKEWFIKFGEIEDVMLLRKPNGDLKGCGFVQYKDLPAAAKAIKECNAKPFLGRPIAVDWAIPKDKYESANKKTEDSQSLEQKDETESQSERDKEDVEEDEDDDNDEDEEEEESSVEDEESGDEEENEEDSDDDQDEELDVKSHAKETNSKKEKSNWKGDNSEVERKSDVGEGKTLFIRNLDFGTSSDSLKNFMEQFGSVHYALLCMDKVMERPKGTAFVKFNDATSAQTCLEKARSSSLSLDGRILDVVLAVTREDLDRKKEQEKNRDDKDKRNLYLAREGYIRPGTIAAKGVSATDMAKRQQNEIWKKQMLQNLHMFISRERLCVHNLPPNLSDKQLLQLFKKNSSKDAKITEARVMRDLKSIGEGNVNPSKGYGFVRFEKHEDALLALRNINNNPNIFTKDRRPIVEFSVENRAAVRARELRCQKSRENVNKDKNEPQEKIRLGMDEGSVPEFGGAKSDPKIKGLPSHSGPKIRHRKRPNPTSAESLNSIKPKIRRKSFKIPEDKKASMKAKLAGKKKNKNAPSTKKGGTQSKTPVPQSSKPKTGGKRKWFDE